MIKYLTQEEEQRLLDSLEGKYIWRNRAILKLLSNTGLRVGELVKLRVEDVMNGGVREELTIRKEISKNGQARTIPLNRVAKESIAILADPSSSPRSPFLLSQSGTGFSKMQVERIVKAAREKAGLDIKATPHSFRHTFAMRIHEKEPDLKILQTLLGHKSLSSTGIYLCAPRGRLKSAIDSIAE